MHHISSMCSFRGLSPLLEMWAKTLANSRSVSCAALTEVSIIRLPLKSISRMFTTGGAATSVSVAFMGLLRVVRHSIDWVWDIFWHLHVPLACWGMPHHMLQGLPKNDQRKATVTSEISLDYKRSLSSSSHWIDGRVVECVDFPINCSSGCGGDWWFLGGRPTTTCCFLGRLYHGSQNTQPLAETLHHLYHSWHERGSTLIDWALTSFLHALFCLNSAQYFTHFFMCCAWHLTLFYLDSAQVSAEAFIQMWSRI